MYAGNSSRKYQKDYVEYVRSLPENEVPCTYHNFADRMRYKKATKGCATVEKSPKRKYDVQYSAYCQTTINPVPYAIFANRVKSQKYRDRKEQNKKILENKIIYKDSMPEGLDGKFVTPPPIDPIVPEKKKFLTPSRFDTILQLVIRLLMTGVLTSYRVPLFTNDTPITNTVIVKVKEKVVYKAPVKKVSKPVSCANK